MSLFSPVFRSLRRSLVARLKLQTGVPCGVYRSSGSRPKLPTKMILLKDIAIRSPPSVLTVNFLHDDISYLASGACVSDDDVSHVRIQEPCVHLVLDREVKHRLRRPL